MELFHGVFSWSFFMEFFYGVKGVKELKELRQMPYCLKSKKKSCCLNSSATAGSDNFFNSFNSFNFFNFLTPPKKKISSSFI